ncbi:DNA internalization-related competence protein ComEC/Rec2 [Geomonas limicola]|uniref:DNA internalization-related competence protein ComEC/Rec2 n=1 Tax=Geomonas limicola TaxID=2740186 RepID=A0A6V8ND44_9BACT|nr:DNA internalization-related competence protein ComEC/Rec2 [Geomonas limicola]
MVLDELLLREGQEHRLPGRLLVHIKQGRVPLGTGDRILFSSKLRRPRLLGLPGESDYPRRLAYQGIFLTGFLKDPGQLVLLESGEGWRYDIDRLAARLGRFLMEHAPPAEAGILKALLIGDTGDVPPELDTAYAVSGVNHILSISGFHVGIIFLCLFQLLFMLARQIETLSRLCNLRRTLLLVALPAVVFYLFLSGTQAATLRSVLMIVAVLLALYLKRELDPVNCIILAAMAILCFAPETLFNLSFQLSFLAIWGLVVLSPQLAAPFSRIKGVRGWLLPLAAASAAAILVTLVPVAFYFHRVSFTGLLANLAVVPLMGYGAVVVGFASLPVCLIAPAAAHPLVQLAAALVRFSDYLIVHLARLPVWNGYCPDRIDLALSVAALMALTLVRSVRLGQGVVLLLVMVLVARGIPAARSADGQLTVIFLSVGQGDAALVRLPDGKQMLVDGGGDYGDLELRVGERLLGPALHALNVDRLDYLVLSHPHPDHLQGVLWAAANLEVGEFWESGIPGDAQEYRKLKWVLASRAVPVRTVNAAGAPFKAGGVLVEPLWPEQTVAVSADENDNSLVFRLRHGQSSVLFTGDLGGEPETGLLDSGRTLAATLLKVPHHGSKYSSSVEFLKAVAPKAAVVSAGFGNNFHLPAPSTLWRLQHRGTRVYRTDLEGSIQAICQTDGTVIIGAPWGHFN